jgi:hypothetical protein
MIWIWRLVSQMMKVDIQWLYREKKDSERGKGDRQPGCDCILSSIIVLKTTEKSGVLFQHITSTLFSVYSTIMISANFVFAQTAKFFTQIETVPENSQKIFPLRKKVCKK